MNLPTPKSLASVLSWAAWQAAALTARHVVDLLDKASDHLENRQENDR